MISPLTAISGLMLRAVTGPEPARRTAPRPTRKARDESDRINVSGGDHVELRRDIGRLSFPDLSPCRDPAQRYATEALPKLAIPVAGRHRVEERPPRARAHSNVFTYFEGRERGGAEQVLSAFWLGRCACLRPTPSRIQTRTNQRRDGMRRDLVGWWLPVRTQSAARTPDQPLLLVKSSPSSSLLSVSVLPLVSNVTSDGVLHELIRVISSF